MYWEKNQYTPLPSELLKEESQVFLINKIWTHE